MSRGPCPVCSQDIASGSLVLCAACHTPHHMDCFEYSGRCAIFACGQTRFVAGSGVVRSALMPVENAAGHQRVAVQAETPLRQLAAGLITSGAAGLAVLALIALWGLLPVILLLSPLLLALTVVSPFVAIGAGVMIRLCEGSEWEIDAGSGAALLTGRILGTRLFQRRIPLHDIAGLDLYEPKGPGGGALWLTLKTRDGRRHWLASGDGSLVRGYGEADLTRIGNRWAKLLQVPFTHSYPPTKVPELPEGG